jgi:hypothetical protein
MDIGLFFGIGEENRKGEQREEFLNATRSWFVFRIMEYMFGSREQSSHFKSLLLSKAILHHVFCETTQLNHLPGS